MKTFEEAEGGNRDDFKAAEWRAEDEKMDLSLVQDMRTISLTILPLVLFSPSCFVGQFLTPSSGGCFAGVILAGISGKSFFGATQH